MKTVIISDTHLTSRVYRKKYNYLKSIIEGADKVIIAGDFWDGFLISFDKFLSSKWNLLFPLLLEKETIYLHGNHDRPEWCDERVSLFSVESGMSTTISSGDHSYFITHGHTVFTSFEDKYPIVNRKIPLRIGSNIDTVHKLFCGKRFLQKESNINSPMMEWVEKNLDDKHILVTGHSHYPEINIEKRLLNSGFIGLGYGNYAVIEPSGPSIIKERY